MFILFNQIFMYVYLVAKCKKKVLIRNSYHLNTEPQSDVALLQKVNYISFSFVC